MLDMICKMWLIQRIPVMSNCWKWMDLKYLSYTFSINEVGWICSTIIKCQLHNIYKKSGLYQNFDTIFLFIVSAGALATHIFLKQKYSKGAKIFWAQLNLNELLQSLQGSQSMSPCSRQAKCSRAFMTSRLIHHAFIFPLGNLSLCLHTAVTPQT